MNDEIDTMLREYAPRWRAAQPPPPAVDLARLAAGPQLAAARRPGAGWRAGWIPVVAVVGAIAVLATGIGLVRSYLTRPAAGDGDAEPRDDGAGRGAVVAAASVGYPGAGDPPAGEPGPGPGRGSAGVPEREPAGVAGDGGRRRYPVHLPHDHLDESLPP